MTKRDHKAMIQIKKNGSLKTVEYCGVHCGTYTATWTNSEIKEDVYQELKSRGMLLGN